MSNGLSQAQAEALSLRVGDSGFTMAGIAEVFVQSGFFKDIKQQSQAIVKIMLGRELGLKEIQSMLSINMVEGRPEVAAATLGAIVKRSGKYDYRVTEHTADACTIEFFEKSSGARESIGISRFEMADATQAGLAGKFNYQHYPKNMMFCRAMSNGVKWYCLDAVGGVPIYTEGEIVEEREALGLPATPAAEPVNEMMPKRKESAVSEQPSASEPVEAVVTEIIPSPEPAPVAPPGRVAFLIGKSTYETAGITAEQMLKTFDLAPKVDKARGKNTAAVLLKEEFGVGTRKDLTAEAADKYLVRLQELVDG